MAIAIGFAARVNATGCSCGTCGWLSPAGGAASPSNRLKTLEVSDPPELLIVTVGESPPVVVVKPVLGVADGTSALGSASVVVAGLLSPTVVLAPPDPLTVTVGDDPSPTVTVACDESVEGTAGSTPVPGSDLAESDGEDERESVDGVDGAEVLSVAPVGSGDELGDPAVSDGLLVSGVAYAIPGMVPTAAPTPSATARAPTRPT